MKKLLILIALSLLLTGCGHNALIYSDGVGVDISLNPENYSIGLNLRYGKILTVAVKEKTKLALKAGMTQNSNAGTESTTGLDTDLLFETGDQVTGYVVDLEEVKQQK